MYSEMSARTEGGPMSELSIPDHRHTVPEILVVNWFVAGGPNPLAVLARMVKE